MRLVCIHAEASIRFILAAAQKGHIVGLTQHSYLFVLFETAFLPISLDVNTSRSPVPTRTPHIFWLQTTGQPSTLRHFLSRTATSAVDPAFLI